MQLNESNRLLSRAYNAIPSASQTFSKGPNQWARGSSPHFLESGEGAWVWDVDGNKYLDWLMALGPISLGYQNPVVDRAITDQLRKGIVFSQMNRLEVEVAEMLIDRIPCAEMVRFGKNGSDATSAAVRVARAYTGRDVILVCGYHGWQDWYIGTTTRHLGVPEAVRALTETFRYNDIASLKTLFDKHDGRVACVVMEGIGVEEPKDGFLSEVAALCRRNGSLLIFDEIVAGFRVAIGGAHEFYKIEPDLACFGKAMANGMPLSAVVGRRPVMEMFDRIFFSGTFGGECLSLAACRATIEVFEREDVINHMWRTGQQLSDGINTLIRKHDLASEVVLLGLPPRSVLGFPSQNEGETLARRTLIMQECVKRGLLYFCSHLPTASHRSPELQFTLGVLDEALAMLRKAISSGDVAKFLDGPPVEPIFRKA